MYETQHYNSQTRKQNLFYRFAGMEHVLDNPAWNALNTGNSHLAEGSNEVKYFDREISPFVGLKNNSKENFQELHELLPAERAVLFVSLHQITIPDGWKHLATISGYQMLYEGDAKPFEPVTATSALTAVHIPQMIALTKLTNPGPFGLRTIEFGYYRGVLDGSEVVAMAGQRLHAFDYTEISAVCTHPDHLSKGYARQLLLEQVSRMKATSTIPYLHVRNDNQRAINVYQSLGFTIRTDVHFYVMMKA